MKLALIYEPTDKKLQSSAYSQVYRSQFLAVQNRFDAIHIVKNCSYLDIEADVILFYDVHSSHKIKIDGIEKHKALKYEYFNDPHQIHFKGYYADGSPIEKLNAEERTFRAVNRGVHYIICPTTRGYYQYIAQYLGNKAEEMFVWFPLSPTIRYFTKRKIPLVERKQAVLANGATSEGNETDGYNFRKWAYSQNGLYYVNHVISKNTTPKGKEYPDFLAGFAGSLALNSLYTVPKYSEIPLAGCLCFAQAHTDYMRMGFKDGENCIYVNRRNFNDKIAAFKNNICDYQNIADNGRILMEQNWTAERFADFIYNHAKERICQ